ncbi:MAG: tetratricopeptide repeat protein [Deltaproteobacteria bacterium]|nr:tetratricopeptide repeat protein [Deltaproteobacteria bacterium]
MEDFAKRVIESSDSDEMAEVLRDADQASRDSAQDLATEFWDNPNNDRGAASVLLLRMATGFAKCKDYSRGTELATILMEYARECSDREMLCAALGTIGVMLMESGEPPEARKVFEEIVAASVETGDAHSRTRALHNLGIIESLEGQSSQAIARFEEALQLARSSGDAKGVQLAKRSLDIEREAATTRVCPQCRGKGLFYKEGYGVVICPECRGSGKS